MKRTSPTPAKRDRSLYKIDLDIDFDHLSYTGVNAFAGSIITTSPPRLSTFTSIQISESADQQPSPTSTASATTTAADEPRMDIFLCGQQRLSRRSPSASTNKDTILRINLREPVAPQGSAEIEIKFKGTVPEIDPDETSLTTHVVKASQRRAAKRARNAARA